MNFLKNLFKKDATVYPADSPSSKTSGSSSKTSDSSSKTSDPSFLTKILTDSANDKLLPSPITILLSLLYIASILYVSEKKTIPFGYIILSFTYIASMMYFIKNAYNTNGYFKNLNTFFSFDILKSFTFANNILKNGIVMSWFFVLLLIIAVIYNLYSIIMVTTSVFMRTRQMQSYDLNLSKSRWNDLVTYSVLFYIIAFSFIYVIYFMPSTITVTNTRELTYTTIVALLFLLAMSCTIANYFIQVKVTTGLQNDSVNKKSEAEKQLEVSDEKTADQNIFKSTYYWFLNLFNNPSMMMP